MTPAERLTEWVALKHKGQIIRRTDLPYFKHLITVATLAGAVVELGYETGLCHDLLEDTTVTSTELYDALSGFGYSDNDAGLITKCVVELTDVFTDAAYPDLSKKERKNLESARLATISGLAQTVKYGDLIDNISWVLKYDQKHAKKYLKKKQLLLESLTWGNLNLRQQLANKIHSGMDLIS